MIDLSVFVVGDKQEINIDNNGYQIEVLNVKEHEIPKKIESRFAVITEFDLSFDKNFVKNAISIADIFDNAGVICGPIKTNSTKNIAKTYEYDLGLSGAEIADITSEQNNYPPINGSLIRKETYNRFTYSPTISHRHTTIENKRFIKLASSSRILYSKNLTKTKYISEEDLTINNLSRYSYNLGYQHGSMLFHGRQDNKKELWFKFVESPEILDRDMPRWLVKDGSDEESLEQIVIIKCNYQIGFFEGLTNKSLI